MANISPKLLDAIRMKTGLSRAAVYARINQKAGEELLPNHLAAIRVAADEGVTINRYATAEELNQLRSAGAPVAPPAPTQLPTRAQPRGRASKAAKPARTARTPNQVFVVHGRDSVARASLFDFLRAVGVKPIEWTSAIAMSGKPSPFIGEILDAAFKKARAIVVLLTPDDLARLRDDLQSPADKPYERNLTGQARPNVLFEAGMAFATHNDRTLLVQLGTVREFSDVAGRHVVHMSNEYDKRKELATKLTNAGCDVDTSGTDWVKAGDFTDPQQRTPTAMKRSASKKR